jgi:hypothetical protein
MAVYATGRKSLAISDRSGFRVPYKNLRTEWNGLRVSPEDYDPKHPQLTPPKNITDATALYEPRPNNDPENVSFYINYNWFGFQNVPLSADGFSQPSLDSQDYKKPNVIHGKGSIGYASIHITLDATVSGVAGTGAVGTETLETSITETGVAGTGALGAFGESDGVNLTLSITETGVAGTGAVGTESLDVDNPTWGSGTWGNGSWGQ